MTLVVVIVAVLLLVLLVLPARGTQVMSGKIDFGSTGRIGLEAAVNSLSVAIARFETGYGQSHEKGFALDPALWQGRAVRNLNPGNLRYIGQPSASGGDEDNYARFPTVAAGWAALVYDVRSKLIGRTRTSLGPHSTLAEFIRVWAPSEDNNPTVIYYQTVAKELEQPADRPFKEWVDFSGFYLK